MSWLARSFLIVAIRMSHVAANCGNKAKGDGELLNPTDILLRICYFMGEPGELTQVMMPQTVKNNAKGGCEKQWSSGAFFQASC